MIYWFSGTGNSQWVAEALADRLGQRMTAIASADCRCDIELAEGEPLGWVFPTHAWAPPALVTEFARRLRLNRQPGYCFVVATCGDDTGMMLEIMQRALGQTAIDAAFSVQMPNTYICLPGFDVDPDALEQAKLDAAVKRVQAIGDAIESRRKVVDVVRGGMPHVKSHVLGPLFRAALITDSKFTVNSGRCSSCGLCERSCPVGNITMDNGRPHWNGNCTMCLGCLHRCPSRAIDWGTITRSKGRYCFKNKDIINNK